MIFVVLFARTARLLKIFKSLSQITSKSDIMRALADLFQRQVAVDNNNCA
jgi:hypothetical protein